MTEPPELTIRPYRPGDEHGILDTFNLVFREVNGEGFVDRTLEQWYWQYRDNPVGQRMSLAVAPDGTVVSQYAGVPLIADTTFGEQVFVHCVDSLSHPAWRAGLRRPGVFVITGLPFSAHSRKIGDALLYGYPVPIAERVGRKFLEYHFLRVVDYLCRDLVGAAPAAPVGVEVLLEQGIPKGVDGLYQAVRGDQGCWLRRDRRYLDWRYVQIPGDDYEVWSACRDGELVGLMVLRPVHELIPDACTVADWLVSPGDQEVGDALLAKAHQRGVAAGRKVLLAVFADLSWEYEWLQGRGFSVVSSGNWLERRLTYLITGSPITEEFLREEWWYTLGDSDLV